MKNTKYYIYNLFTIFLIFTLISAKNKLHAQGCSGDSSVHIFGTHDDSGILYYYTQSNLSYDVDSGKYSAEYFEGIPWTSPFYSVGYFQKIDTIFNFNNQPSEIITQVGDSTGWDTTYIITFQYDLFNRIILETEKVYINSWENVRQAEYSFTTSGLFSKIISRGNGTMWENDSMYTFSYNGLNRDSVNFSVWDTLLSTWNLQSQANYQLNNGQFTAHLQIEGPDSINALLRNNIFFQIDTLENILSYYSFTSGYDTTYADTAALEKMYQQSYHAGKLLMDLSGYNKYQLDPVDGWVLFETFDYTTNNYDSLGRILSYYHTHTNGPNMFSSIDAGSYTYDSLGRLLTEWNHVVGHTNYIESNYYYSYLDTTGVRFVLSEIDSTCPGSVIQPLIGVVGSCGPFHYRWSPSTGLSSDTIQFPNITVQNSITYMVIVSDDFNNADTTFVSADPLISLEITVDSLTVPGTFILSVPYDASISYQWYSDGLAIPFGDSSTFGVVLSGNYYVEAVSSTCSAQSDSIFIGTTGIAQIDLNDFILIPNPASEWITLKKLGLSKSSTEKIRLVNSLGSVVLEKVTSSVDPIKIDVSLFPPGIYYLILSDDMDNKSLSRKLVLIN